MSVWIWYAVNSSHIVNGLHFVGMLIKWMYRYMFKGTLINPSLIVNVFICSSEETNVLQGTRSEFKSLTNTTWLTVCHGDRDSNNLQLICFLIIAESQSVNQEDLKWQMSKTTAVYDNTWFEL